MFSNLRCHPFAVETFFKSSVVLTFAISKDELQPLIPKCLSLDTLNNHWGFLAIALVQTKKLRPKGFPEFMGSNFILVGYRIFVRYITSEGKNIRGLYILKSETNKIKMSLLGNLFTRYQYTTTDIKFYYKDPETVISSNKSHLHIEMTEDDSRTRMPELSPFKDWKEARRYAGPLPFTFSYNGLTNEVLIIEGVRKNWVPEPIRIKNYNIGFLKDKQFNNIVLANAFIIKNVPYYWKKGRNDLWNAQ
jgi:hypothetical protein